MSIDISTLNKPQADAVTTTTGPVLILAGAGSGKTRVLTYRIAYLLEQRLAMPEQILAVTFTNKAAGEMKQRIASLIGSAVPLPWMGTFHAICVKILKRDGHYLGLGPNFSIYDPADQLDAVKEAMDKLNISKKEINPNAVHGHISSAKNEMVDVMDYENFAQGFFQETVAKIYPLYQKILKENNAVDFDDLLLMTVKLFKQFPQVLEKYQDIFQYILVDEYQDTNNVQYVMVNMLARKHRNICCVGDDDQSIYSFRGANIRNILNFERDYPEAKVIKLEQNYRSTKMILDAAHEVVRKNKQRTDKKLWTDKDGGEKIIVYTASDEHDEANWLVGEINRLVSTGVDPEDIAVLYRTNAQSRALEEGFVRNGTAYRIIGGVRFYERKEIKDILAYLRIIYNPKDDNSLKRIINVPKRAIGPKAFSDLLTQARERNKSGIEFLLQNDNEIGNRAIAEFAGVLKEMMIKTQTLNIVDLIHFILEKTGYVQMLDDGSQENAARLENLQELISVAAKYMQLPPMQGLTLFLEEVSLLEGEAEQAAEQRSVTLMTIHAAKGLEFEYVFVVGAEEGLFPHSRVFTDPHELEEERRLAYVAITRAKKQLYLSHAQSRVYFGARQSNMVSRFLEDIPDNLITRRSADIGYGDLVEDRFDDWGQGPEMPQIQVGEKVKHEYFGIGKVMKIDDDYVTIDFGPVYGKKELAREFAPLQKL
jgi:DNA helicase-2/ATP-dependent DNA helicase PcrA